MKKIKENSTVPCCLCVIFLPLIAGILYIFIGKLALGITFLSVSVVIAVILTSMFLSKPVVKRVKQYRKHIETRVKQEVWRRDQGRCVECSSKEKLEYDHIIPISKGGSNTVRNIQLLCEKCNRSKSNKIK